MIFKYSRKKPLGFDLITAEIARYSPKKIIILLTYSYIYNAIIRLLQFPIIWKLHKIHNDFPFLPENTYSSNSKVKILLITLSLKHNYIIHYKNLIQAIAFGLQLILIHRIIRFDQAKWMTPYISLCTSMRVTPSNKFKRKYWKLLINSVFGKCMENVRK